MGAAPTHLMQLDRIQHVAEKIGRFTCESLQSRREAAAMIFTLKLLNGDGRGVLKKYVPEVKDYSKMKRTRDSRHAAVGLQLVSRCEVCSLDGFKRGYIGSIHQIWSKIPQEIIRRGEELGWLRIKKACKSFLTGKMKEEESVQNKKSKSTERKDGITYEEGISEIDVALRIKV